MYINYWHYKTLKNRITRKNLRPFHWNFFWSTTTHQLIPLQFREIDGVGTTDRKEKKWNTSSLIKGATKSKVVEHTYIDYIYIIDGVITNLNSHSDLFFCTDHGVTEILSDEWLNLNSFYGLVSYLLFNMVYCTSLCRNVCDLKL